MFNSIHNTKQYLLDQLEEHSEHTGVVLTVRTAPFAVKDFGSARQNLNVLRRKVQQAQKGACRNAGAVIISSGLAAIGETESDRRMCAVVKILVLFWRRKIKTRYEAFCSKIHECCHLLTPFLCRLPRDGEAEFAVYDAAWRHVSVDGEVLTRPVTRAMIEKHGLDPKKSVKKTLAGRSTRQVTRAAK